MLGSASSSAHHLHSLVLPRQQRPELLGVHAGHHLRMDPSWPARAASCIAVSSHFPVSCFVIFLRRVAACAALGESIANTATADSDSRKEEPGPGEALPASCVVDCSPVKNAGKGAVFHVSGTFQMQRKIIP